MSQKNIQLMAYSFFPRDDASKSSVRESIAISLMNKNASLAKDVGTNGIFRRGIVLSVDKISMDEKEPYFFNEESLTLFMSIFSTDSIKIPLMTLM